MENRGGVGWGCSVFLVCVHPPVFKVRLAPPPPPPPAGLLSLPAAPVWTSACLQGSTLTALGQSSTSSRNTTPAARPTAGVAAWLVCRISST